jgi:hypothetical protein
MAAPAQNWRSGRTLAALWSTQEAVQSTPLAACMTTSFLLESLLIALTNVTARALCFKVAKTIHIVVEHQTRISKTLNSLNRMTASKKT